MLRLGALAAVVVFTSISAVQKPARADALANIKAAGTFNYGLGGAYRPFGFRDESNNLVGFDIDLANEIARRLGVQAKPVEAAWATIIQSLNDGSFQTIIGGMTATPERFKRVNFSVPYMEASTGILVLKKDNISTPKDLAGKVVGAATGTPQLQQLEITAKDLGITYGDAVQTYQEDALAFEAMRAGRLQGYASSLVSLLDFAKTNDAFTVIQLKSDKWPTQWTCAAFRKTDEDFRTAFNDALLQMEKDGTLAKLHIKWFGQSFVDGLPKTAPSW
jgi:polar amino acid transport system substrate-binding protein